MKTCRAIHLALPTLKFLFHKWFKANDFEMNLLKLVQSLMDDNDDDGYGDGGDDDDDDDDDCDDNDDNDDSSLS